MNAEMDNAVTLLKLARNVVVFTGAGASAESGIATFRDALTGLWSRYEAQRLATAPAFKDDPSLVWGWYEWRRAQAAAATPNAGHIAIAQLAHYVETLTVATQNVDDLHERAGSETVYHLHGSLNRPRCFDCSSTVEAPLPETESMRPAKSSTQPRNARTWCALKFRWTPVLAF